MRNLFAAFSPDGRRVVTASDDNTARAWDAETGELLGQPMKHTGTVRFAAFLGPNGDLIVTAAADQTARVWESATGNAITPALEFDEAIQRAEFEGDGEVVRLTGTGGMVWRLDLHGDNRPAADLAEPGLGLLSGTRLDPDRGPLPLEADVLRHTWEQMRERYPDEFTFRNTRLAASNVCERATSSETLAATSTTGVTVRAEFRAPGRGSGVGRPPGVHGG